MNTAPTSVIKNRGHEKKPVLFHATALPRRTGTMVAVKKGALTALSHNLSFSIVIKKRQMSVFLLEQSLFEGKLSCSGRCQRYCYKEEHKDKFITHGKEKSVLRMHQEECKEHVDSDQQ